ncbi:MAG: MFS transporter [Ectothiorhodospiraceae bacterium]|nr:MFS transporter [Ectothiorhodospiraceae bacterium]
MYDWANSAFAMTILAALFGPYLEQAVVPEGGVDIPLLGMSAVSATSLYGYVLGLSAFLVLLSSPILGAIADRTSAKKKFLSLFCYTGSAATLLMFFVGPGDVWLALGLFFIANFSFVSANVFYDSFLPHLAPPSLQDVVSGKGYAYGYAGGGLLFVIHLLLVQFYDSVGLPDTGMAVRIALGSVGLWWGGFAMITLIRLEEPPGLQLKDGFSKSVRFGLKSTVSVLRRIGKTRQLLLYLVAFMIYNDGIQTVIAMATIYGAGELGFDTLTLMGCLLMVQVVGIFGSRLFGFLAGRYGTKSMLIVSLVIWSGVVIYAFFMTQQYEFWVLGGIVGLVLGGSQALSRSYYSKIIPAGASAEFFGFFSVFEKFSAIWGPIAFAVIRQISGSGRMSIISLIVFFVVGVILLAFVNTAEAEKEKHLLFEAASAT